MVGAFGHLRKHFEFQELNKNAFQEAYPQGIDTISIIMILVIVLLCVLSVVYGFRRSLDRRANDIQHQYPDTARALREAQRSMDIAKGTQDPRI